MEKRFLGLRTTIYTVSNLQEAIEWYSRVFETEPYFNEPFYVGFNIAGYELGLMPEEHPVINKTANVLSYWGVEDVEKEYNRMLEAGATSQGAPQNVGGPIVVAELKDPWDNVIGLICNPVFKLP